MLVAARELRSLSSRITKAARCLSITELAAQIRSAKNRKRIVAAIDPLGASAVYWLAAQASEIAITPSGMAGSVGIIAAHKSVARALEQAGIETTLVAGGMYKGEGDPLEKLTPRRRQRCNNLIDIGVHDLCA